MPAQQGPVPRAQAAGVPRRPELFLLEGRHRGGGPVSSASPGTERERRICVGAVGIMCRGE